jgi:hypothetical protein
MRERGITEEQVENTVHPDFRIGAGDEVGTSIYQHPITGVRVVINDSTGKIITVTDR